MNGDLKINNIYHIEPSYTMLCKLYKNIIVYIWNYL